MKLAPYPEYRDSGVPWLGKIPAHWESRKLRNIMTPVSVRNRPDLPLLSVVREKGVIKRDVSNKEENHNYVPDDLSNYKVVNKSQFAMNKMKAWQGSYGVSDFDGIVSPAYFVFDLDGAEGKFFHVAARSKAYVPFFTQASDGVRVGQWDLNQSRMKEIPFFVPSVAEQNQIASFLDWQTAQITKFIRNKRRLIELFKEQRQNIINQAVTRGLNPNVKLKPSGVEWIGDIPDHWDVIPLKRIFPTIRYGTSTSAGDEGQYAVLGMGNIKEGEIQTHGCGRLNDISPELVLQENDLLFNRTNSAELVGKVGIFRGTDKDDITFASYLVLLRANESANPEFINYQLNSVDFLSFVRRHAIPSLHQSNLNPTRYSRFRNLLPPLSEQKEIVTRLGKATTKFDEAITRANLEIELMREYRTRLISDVVTGKVDVRGIEVPEVAEEELLTLDEDTSEADDVIDDEEDIDETD